ncbi:hypothetical protein EYB53_017185 [Candidatus Chloroploca sp. M-50]|uniref:DUF2281 domain-containing protein n=1 Tax=Candidatus Chloroploca mongolica TaxID=2528176 RepID=A0ABS4DDC2_9CHLR|nr:hypothetical protein [Candidatus Chloroploca mongolica]
MSLEHEILTTLAKLAPAQQRQVLDFVRFLPLTPAGVTGQSLLTFAGTIQAHDLTQMQHPIDTDCEQVNVNEW